MLPIQTQEAASSEGEHLRADAGMADSRDGVEVNRISTDTEFSWTFARTITIDKELWIQKDRRREGGRDLPDPLPFPGF